jgi:hypothetical protein
MTGSSTANNLIDVPNIYPPPDLTKQFIHASDRRTISIIRSYAYGVCRTQIADSYIHSAFNKFKNGFVYFKDNEPISFCIWKVRSKIGLSGAYDPELLIFLVCSIKQSFNTLDMILYDVDNYCKENGIHSIVLEPANDNMRAYYRSKGFADLPPSNRDMYRKVATTIIYRPSNNQEHSTDST